MEPPICSVCDRDQRDHPNVEFGLVKFADYEPLDIPGHPDGLQWFCADHLPKAQKFAHLDSSTALKKLRGRWWAFLRPRKR